MLVQLSGLLGLTQSETIKTSPDASGEGDFAEIFAKLDHSTSEPDQQVPAAEVDETDEVSEADEAELTTEEPALEGADVSGAESKQDRSEPIVLESGEFSDKDQWFDLSEGPISAESDQPETRDQIAAKLGVEASDFSSSKDFLIQSNSREIGGETPVERTVLAATKIVESIVLGKARLSFEVQPKPTENSTEIVNQLAPNSFTAVPEADMMPLSETSGADGRHVTLVPAEGRAPAEQMTPAPSMGGEAISSDPNSGTELSAKTVMKVADTNTVHASLPPEVEQTQDILFASRKRPDALPEVAETIAQSAKSPLPIFTENRERIVTSTQQESVDVAARSGEQGSKTALQSSQAHSVGDGQKTVLHSIPLSQDSELTVADLEPGTKPSMGENSEVTGTATPRFDHIGNPLTKGSIGTDADNSLKDVASGADAKDMPKPEGAGISIGDVPKTAQSPTYAPSQTEVSRDRIAPKENVLHQMSDIGETDGLDISVRTLASEPKPKSETVGRVQAAPLMQGESALVGEEPHQVGQRSDPVLAKPETGGPSTIDNSGPKDSALAGIVQSQIRNTRTSDDLSGKPDRSETSFEAPKTDSKQSSTTVFHERPVQPSSQSLGLQTSSVTYPFLFDAEDVADAQELIQITPTGELRRSVETAVLAQSPTAPRANAAQVVQQLVDGAQKLSDGGVELRLSPEELGTVRMQFVHSEQGLTVNIQAERPETLELIKRNIDQLARDLAASGFDSAGFSFGDEGEPRQQQFGSNNDEVAVEEQQTVPPSMSVSQDGLDIRV